jgi:hypothetical protein
MRPIVDLDYDGAADPLVLFQGTHAVFVKTRPALASPPAVPAEQRLAWIDA